MAAGGAFGPVSGEGDRRRLRYVEVAAENYRLLNQGLEVLTDLEVRHTGWLANGVLLAWVLLSGGLLHAAIRRRTQAEERRRLDQEERIAALSGQLDRARSLVREVEEKEKDYRQRIDELRRQRDDLSQDAEALFEELDQLEQGAARQRNLREETENEILELREEVQRLEGRLRKDRKKQSDAERLRKRLGVLYKNLEFTDRAVEGMAALQPDVRLRAEEAVQLLNTDASKVAVKRKVFGKGGKGFVLEAGFAYSGRLYFHRNGGRVHVVAIGTKNTQTKDLAYLESYRSAAEAKP
jgi:predicted RNase H-like nuclease (RuvC/YqgF family)